MKKLRKLLAKEIADIEAEGFEVYLQTYVKDNQIPREFGRAIAGVTIPEHKVVKARTHGFTADQVKAILRHELHHVKGELHGPDVPELGMRCGGAVESEDLWKEEEKGQSTSLLLAKGVSLKPSEAAAPQRHLNLYIEVEVIKEAKIKAVRRGVSLSSVVNKLLKEWLG